MEIKITIKTKLGSTGPLLFNNKEDANQFISGLHNTISKGEEITLHINHAETKISSLDIQGVEITY